MTGLRSTLFPLLLAVLLCGTAGAASYRIVVDDAGRHWFADGDGKLFISLGVCAVQANDFRPPPESIYYGGPDGEPFNGDFDAWQASTVGILRDAGFNTLGAWSNPQVNDGSLLAMPILYIITAEPDRLANILRPGMEDMMRAKVREVLAEHSHPERIVGFFLDNEMSWWGPTAWTVRANSTLLEAIMGLPPSDPARRAAAQFLRDLYQGDIARFNAAWGLRADGFDSLSKAVLETSITDQAIADRDAFTEMMAERFFTTASRVLSEEAPGKLNLGVRFAGSAPASVLRLCGEHCDVISMNAYSGAPSADERLLAQVWLATGKPMMITEYSWRGRINRSGNPNTRGAGAVVRTQEERGANYQAFVEDTIAHPQVIGLHWFAWADQSPQGRFDGENSNYGIVDIFHRPYEELTGPMGAANRRAEAIHASSRIPLPTELPPASDVLVEPGQFPDRPPVVDLLAHEPIQPHEAFDAPDASFALRAGPDGRGLVLFGNSGGDWGGGVSLFGPRSSATGSDPAHAVDLDGYTELVIDFASDRALFIEVVLDEASVDAPGSIFQRTPAGDDGESFGWPPMRIEEGESTVRLRFADLSQRWNWGNQQGNRRLDLHALRGPAIVVQGGQGEVSLAIRSVRFEKGS